MGNGNLEIPKFLLILQWFEGFWAKGLREGNSNPRVACAAVLRRYGVLCSTASHSFRLSAARTPASIRTVGALNNFGDTFFVSIYYVEAVSLSVV